VAELITMPKMGFDMAEGTLVQWVKKEGDAVAEGDVLAIIETDKANVEVTAFKSGTLRKTLVDTGTVVPVGKAIAVIGAADEEIASLLGPEAAPAPQAELVTAEAGAEAAPAPAEAVAPDAGRALASPVARRMAQELGIDLGQVRGSGPGGRVIKEDIEAFIRQRAEAPPKPAPPTPLVTPSQAPVGVEYAVELFSPMRKTISRRMTESKQQAPHFYVTMEVDMEAAMALRQEMNALLPEDEKISVNDMIVKAVAIALRQLPRLNASLAGDEIHVHRYVNIGIAVALDSGLITIVVKDCDQKPLAQIARQARAMIVRAREGHMLADDIVGSTFTISNLGMYGVEDFAAIINPPQAAILAVSAVRRVPVVSQAGQLVVGTRMKMTLSADHRVTDGAESASFLQALKAVLEQPMRLVL
jgi:pyruvate dehydrogenase E2 component (dihydrolipoyllysine-residue acetyltransferase)